jgi:hypothetical protein
MRPAPLYKAIGLPAGEATTLRLTYSLNFMVRLPNSQAFQSQMRFLSASAMPAMAMKTGFAREDCGRERGARPISKLDTLSINGAVVWAFHDFAEVWSMVRFCGVNLVCPNFKTRLQKTGPPGSLQKKFFSSAQKTRNFCSF